MHKLRPPQTHVPANGYLDGSTYGKGWACERGFRETGNTCVKVDVPGNGHLDTAGRDWKCSRGFVKVAGNCSEIRLPEHAFLSYSGNSWDCEKPFQKIGDKCQSPKSGN